MDMAQIGAAEVELEPYQHPRDQLGDRDVARVEHSADSKVIYDHLRMLRRAEPQLVHDVYLLAPGGVASSPQFVVDADVLDLEARAAQSEATEEISHFAQPYDLSEIPLLKKGARDLHRAARARLRRR
jgi:hypothetical protein